MKLSLHACDMYYGQCCPITGLRTLLYTYEVVRWIQWHKLILFTERRHRKSTNNCISLQATAWHSPSR